MLSYAAIAEEELSGEKEEEREFLLANIFSLSLPLDSSRKRGE